MGNLGTRRPQEVLGGPMSIPGRPNLRTIVAINVCTKMSRLRITKETVGDITADTGRATNCIESSETLSLTCEGSQMCPDVKMFWQKCPDVASGLTSLALM